VAANIARHVEPTSPDELSGLTAQLQRLSPVPIDGVPHLVWVIDVRSVPGSQGFELEVKVAARNPSGRHYIGRFRIDADRLADEGSARAIAVMEQVIRGNLPPTAGLLP
jgi:hypothetical protein